MNEDEAFDFLIENLIAFQMVHHLHNQPQPSGKRRGLKVQEF